MSKYKDIINKAEILRNVKRLVNNYIEQHDVLEVFSGTNDLLRREYCRNYLLGWVTSLSLFDIIPTEDCIKLRDRIYKEF